MRDPHRMLLIYGSRQIADQVMKALSDQTLFDVELEMADNLTDGLAFLNNHLFQTLVLDLGLPDAAGVSAIQSVLAFRMRTAIIVLTEKEDIREGLELMKMGAHNYLPKDSFDEQRLLRSILISQEMIRLNKVSFISEEQSSKIFDECPLGIAHVNKEFRFVDVNEVFCRMMGYGKDELLRMTFKEITHPDHLTGDIQSIQQLIKKEIPVYKTEKRYIRKDHKVIWARLNVSSIYDTSGKILHLLAMVEDITDAKASEQQARIAEEKFRNLFESSPIGISLTSLDGTLHINQAFSQITGYTEQELSVMKWSDITHPDDMEVSAEMIRVLMEGEEDSFHLQKRYVRKDGRFIWADVNTSLYRNEKDEPVHFITLISDITEKKIMEEKLRESESSLRAILDASTESVCLLTPDGKVIAANETTARRLGVPLKDLYTKDIYSFIPGPVAMVRKEKINQVAREQRAIMMEDYRNDIWFESTIYPVIRDGQTSAIAIYATDITQRKKAEEEKAGREILLTSVLESTGAGILVVDQRGKVTHYNQVFTKMWNIPEDIISDGDDNELLAFVLDQLHDPDQFLNKVRELYHSSRIDSDELRFRDGRIFERLSYPLVLGDTIMGRVWSFRDITHMRNTEDELQKANIELTELNATKDKFFSIIAHDLRSPFNALLGLSKILSDPDEQLSPDDMKKFAGRIHSTLTGQFELLQNLLDWARLQQGKVEFHPVRFNLCQAVNNISGLLSGTLLKKNIVLENNLDETSEVCTDSNAMISVIQNVISNAIKFTHPNGMIWVYSQQTDGQFELCIRDSGIGISSERMNQILKLDTVSSTKGTEGEKGTGLGLIVCRELLEKQHCSMRITSEEQKGTTVIISIPGREKL